MILEAVWFKNGKEVAWVDPILEVRCDDNTKNICDIKVYNGWAWYTNEDMGEDDVDDFIIRIKTKPLSDYCN